MKRSVGWILGALFFVALLWIDGGLDVQDLRRILIVFTLVGVWWYFVGRQPSGPIRLEARSIVWKEVSGTTRRVHLSTIRRVIVQQEFDDSSGAHRRLYLKLFTPERVYKVPIHHVQKFNRFIHKVEIQLAARDINVLYLDPGGRIAKSAREDRSQ
ncbi:hypothetical protein [Lewinella sp. IMCC34183]|uniref:hypothetical protein n=1 Tax=Lewinella sp. IMCC34183 TaxID=2248762 RepID=UPI0013002EEC|nr:hypothetical protein [Lewinella sp. IMCC34183]